MQELFSGILVTIQPGDSRKSLAEDIEEFLFIAGNQLCDDDHNTLAHEAGTLLRRMKMEKL